MKTGPYNLSWSNYSYGSERTGSHELIHAIKKMARKEACRRDEYGYSRLLSEFTNLNRNHVVCIPPFCYYIYAMTQESSLLLENSIIIQIGSSVSQSFM
jgi:hypothetical protein